MRPALSRNDKAPARENARSAYVSSHGGRVLGKGGGGAGAPRHFAIDKAAPAAMFGARSATEAPMQLLQRVKGFLLDPAAEWAAVEAEAPGVPALYREHILYLAAIPPFATFLGALFFGYAGGPHAGEHPAFFAGLYRAVMQYGLSLPLLYVVAFVISSLAPHFDGKQDDAKALALMAYSYTPAWLAELSGLIPGMRWLDVLGFYGVYLFYLGLPRMLKCPKDHADVFTLIVFVLTIATAALHAFIVHWIAPIAVG
jgi:hypothetical protein